MTRRLTILFILMFLTAALAVIALPIYNTQVVYPKFTRHFVQNVESEAIRISRHLALMYLDTDKPLGNNSIPSVLGERAEDIKQELGLWKMKIFSPTGEVLFSTSPGDIGKINKRTYFHQVVARGDPFTKVVEKDAQTLEGQTVTYDVVETYVPLMSNGRFNGAFELYYDITYSTGNLKAIISQTNTMLYGISAVLLAAVFLSMFKARGALKEQRLAELETAQARRDWEDTFNTITDMITIHDDNFNIINANNAARTGVGIEGMKRITGKCYKHYHGMEGPPEGCPSCKCRVTGKPAQFEMFEPHLGRYIEIRTIPRFDAGGYLIGLIHIVRDITDRKKMEAETRKASNLESLGTMAGGIAHDFNNALTAITSNLFLAKTMKGREDVEKRLGAAQKAVDKAKGLAGKLLTFSKGGAPLMERANVMEFIKESVSNLNECEQAEFRYEMHDDVWAVRADKELMRQALQNIIINACESMPLGGTVDITTRNISVSQGELHPLEAGHYVRVSVTDSGMGVSEENMDKVFDPYFSTKPNGHGLGLTTAYSIVNKHSGHIYITSTPGQGSKVDIYMPADCAAIEDARTTVQDAAPNKVEVETVTEQAEPPPPALPEDGEDALRLSRGNVLLMDDEEIIRDSVGTLLECLGYEVTSACDGSEAIALYTEAESVRKPFDIIIMDLTVPGGMGGVEAMRKLKEIDPKVRAVVSSGYSDDPVMSEYRDYGFCNVVTKPYEINELTKVLSKAMK